MLTLSKKELVGIVGQETPLCVISELCGSHGLKIISLDQSNVEHFSQVLFTINTAPLECCVNDKFNKNSQKQLEGLATFINHFVVGWPVEDLKSAFVFYQRFVTRYLVASDVESLKISILDIRNIFQLYHIGLPKPSRPKSVSPCMLYNICKSLGVTLNHEATCEDMRDAILFHLYSLKTIQQQACRLMMKLNKSQLTSVIKRYSSLYGDEFDCLEAEYDSLIVKRDLNVGEVETCYNLDSSHTDPKKDEEAVAKAAKVMDVDLQQAHLPLLEYRLILSDAHKGYHDPFYRYTHRSGRFDITQTFNNYLPLCVYSSKNLRSFCIRDGLSVEDVTRLEAQDLLCINNLSKTFYHGLTAFPFESSTITGYDMDELDVGDVVMYGTADKYMNLTSYSELYQYFRINKNNVSPFNNKEVISVEALTKLYNMIQKHHPKMIVFISVIEGIIDQMSKMTPEFIGFKEFDVKRSSKIEILRALESLGFAMRGYIPGVSKELPISVALVDDQDRVDVEVNDKSHEFERLIEASGMKNVVHSLPLFKWVNGSYTRSGIEGYMNIGQRLKDVQKGEEITACIRTSSNWICSTAHHYLVLMEEDPRFIVQDMAHIA